MAVVRERPFLLLIAWTAIALAMILYVVNGFMTMTQPWINKFWIKSDLKGWYTTKAENLGLFPPVPLYAFFTKQVVFGWVPLTFISLMAIWQRNWPFRVKTGEVGSFDANELMRQEPNWWTIFKRQGSLFFNYQLPPRRFWNAIIDQGLNITDLIVICLWLSLNIMWIYFSFYLYWPYMELYYQTNGEHEFITKMGDYTEALGYATAWSAVFNLTFFTLLFARGSFWQYLFNSDFSSIIRYHRWLGHGLLWSSLIHGLFFWIGWWSISTAHFREQTFAWQSVDVNYLAGSISLIPFGLMIWIGSIPIIRRKFFKICALFDISTLDVHLCAGFLTSHIIGFIGFFIFLEIHYPPSVWYSLGLVMYFLDVTFRLAQWRTTSGMQCSFVSADKTFVTLKLKFQKDAKVRSNQFVFVNSPSTAYFQWHPISIAAVYPGADGVSQDVILHIKSYGAWSKDLIARIAEHGSIPVRVDGPYGSASAPEWTHYDHIVMVAGGIGITPLLSMLREIQGYWRTASSDEKLGSQQQIHGLPSSVNLVWAVKRRDELQLLDQDLMMVAGQPGSWLKLQLFHTQEGDEYVEAGSAQKNGLSQGPQHNERPITTCLPAYHLGDFHWALCHLFAFAGTFFALLLVSAYNYEGAITGDQEGEGIKIWTWAFLFMLAFIVGSMGIPALLIFPYQAIRYKRHVKLCERVHADMNGSQQPYNGAVNGNEQAKMSPDQVRNLLPDSKVEAGTLDLETGKSATVSYGRPHLKKIITEAVAGLPTYQTVGVIASGPPSLVMDARDATHKASKIAAKAGLRGLPELAFSNHSFTL